MIASASLVSTACVLPVFLLGAMTVQIRHDIGISTSGIGLAFACFFVTASLASSPGGRLADRGNPVRVARLAAVGSAVAALLVACFARTLPMILLALAAAGVANAVCQTAANLIIVRGVPVHRHGVGLAVK